MRFLTRLAIIVVLIPILLVVVPTSTAQSDQNDEAPPSIVLIEQAYRNGRIDYDTAIQYKVFSIFEPQRLPVEYQSTTPAKSATTILIEVNRNWQILRPETRNKLSSYPVGRLGLPLFRGPILSGPESTYSTTHFQIHYTTSGVDAVDTTDNNTNGIPDYIESMGTELEDVWTTELSTMGWLQPPSDVSVDGNPDYDVYVEDMLYYGYAQPEALADQGTAIGDNENSPGVTEVNAAYGYIALENDYAGSPLTPLDCIRVTAAHEFNHAIQFGYDVFEEIWLMEATATWMEDEVYDSINDGLQYLDDYFDNPDVAMPSETPGLHWYGDWIFPRYISEHHGGQSTVRSIWENSVNYDSYGGGPPDYGKYSFDAIQDALSSVGTSLAVVFNNFTVANYVMSTSPTNDPYCYEEASSYPSVYIEGNINYSGSTVNYTPSDGVGNYSADYITINPTTDQAKITVSGASSSITYAAKVVGMQSGVPTVVDIPMTGSPASGSVSLSTTSYDTVILIVLNRTPDSSSLALSGYSVQVAPAGAAPPSVTTNNASNITSTSATLNGNLSSKGTASTVFVSFEYGATTAYGNETTAQAMTTTGPFSFNLSSLSPNTTYHFRGKAVGNGTSYGSNKSFTTLPPGVPPATTATRHLPAGVEPGTNFDVGITASDYGGFGQIIETLPAGFTYVSVTGLEDFQVSVADQVVSFTLLGETAFSYTVMAPPTAAVGTFSGILKDSDLNEYVIGGDTLITEGWDPWAYDEDGSGAIEKDEAVAAVNDYFLGEITKAQVVEVIVLYFGQ